MLRVVYWTSAAVFAVGYAAIVLRFDGGQRTFFVTLILMYVGLTALLFQCKSPIWQYLAIAAVAVPALPLVAALFSFLLALAGGRYS